MRGSRFSLNTAVPRCAEKHTTQPAWNYCAATSPAGQMELKVKKTWRDVTMHLVMSPLEFMQPLAALIQFSQARPYPPMAASRQSISAGG